MSWHVMRLTIVVLFAAQLFFLLPTYTVPTAVPTPDSTMAYALPNNRDTVKVIEGKGKEVAEDFGRMDEIGKAIGGTKTAGILLGDRILPTGK